MKKSIRHILILCGVALTAALACKREALPAPGEDEVTIIAEAILGEEPTKMIVEDMFPLKDSIKTGWVNGDTFLALEINGSNVTPVTFTATASKLVKATFTSSGAVAADNSTKWVAVLGGNARFEGGRICCSYSGQDGGLTGIEDTDYMTATASGPSPVFDFGTGQHLSYLLRIKMPAGVGRIEFNTCADKYEWSIGADGKSNACTIDYHKEAVRYSELASETAAGQTVYLSVPAVDYTQAGLIVTAMNKAGTKSQGQVKSADFSSLAGKVGTFEMDELIDRPLSSDAIDFVSEVKVNLLYDNASYEGINDNYSFVKKNRWAPFNLGASASPSCAEDFYGSYFAWGETNQKENYSEDNYKHARNHSTLGIEKIYSGESDNRMGIRNICGTKYDAARVKWGHEWRMPLMEEMIVFTGDNATVDLTAGKIITTDSQFLTTDVQQYNGIEVSGRKFERNGRTLFLPFSGRYFYSAGSSTSTPSMVGKAGFYRSASHNNTSGSREAFRLQVRSTLVDYQSQDVAYAFSIRPVLAESSDIDPKPVLVSGTVSDSKTGRGIAGVNVSDGFNCTLTDNDGRYSLEANQLARAITVTIPAGYEIPIADDGKPAFYKLVNLRSAREATADFSLEPRAGGISDTFTLVTVADDHVKDNSNLSQFKTSMADVQKTVSELRSSGTAGEIIGIALGDQLWDNMDMASPVKNVYTNLKCGERTLPFFYVIGNHDHQSGFQNFDAEYLSTELFIKNFGPTDYSFDIGNAHVIVMDDIYNTGNDGTGSHGLVHIGYKTQITGEQLHWLKQDIENVSGKQDKIVIFCTHAPIFNAIGNGPAITSLLCKFKEAHIMSGHIHDLKNDMLAGIKTHAGRTVIEHNIQSLSGMWWLADLSPNGTPAGYNICTFTKDHLCWEYNKITKQEKDFQMRVYSGSDSYDGNTPCSPGESRKQNTTFSWDSSLKGYFLVRIWGGEDPSENTWSDTWKVNFVYDGKSIPMTRITDSIIDKCAAGYMVNILGSPYGSKGTLSSISWWKVEAPGGDPSKVTGWKIEASHEIPNGRQTTYSCTKLSRDYKGYKCGSNF